MNPSSQKKTPRIHLFRSEEKAKASGGGYQRRRRSPAKLLLIRLLIVSAVLFVIYLIWNNWQKIAPESVLDWAAVQFGDGEEGEGYPYSIAGNTVAGLGEVNNYLAVLTDNSLKLLNQNGGCVEERPHAFSDPLMETVGRYALITEIGGSRFRLETRRETVLEMELENRKIYATDVNADGVVAVATDSAAQNYICGIQVFRTDGSVLFEYKTGKYLITNLCLSPNGRALAAAGTYSEGGTLKAALLLFDFNTETPQIHVGEDILLYDLAYFNTGKVLAVGDTAYWVANVADNTVEKIAYNGMEPVGYTASATQAGLIMRQSGSTGSGEVWLFDATATRTAVKAFDGNFRHAACRDKELVVLTDTAAFLIGGSTDGTRFEVPSDSLMVCRYRGKPYLLTLSDLHELK